MCAGIWRAHYTAGRPSKSVDFSVMPALLLLLSFVIVIIWSLRARRANRYVVQLGAVGFVCRARGQAASIANAARSAEGSIRRRWCRVVYICTVAKDCDL